MELSSHTFLIIASLIVVVSYLFNIISRKTSIPSVLLLIIAGFSLKQVASLFEVKEIDLFPILEILGTVGLIMIVLEAALDLELKRDRLPIILKSFIIALFGIIFSVAIISFIFIEFLEITISKAVLYAVPLSILSSAIVIPSIGKLSHYKKEFMIYESTFSDILGIMLFYFIISGIETNNKTDLAWDIVINLSITIIISVVVSYLLVFIFQKINTKVKLFLLISVLILLYSIGKIFHLSSLLIILVFGLIINNQKVFFKGKLNKWLNQSAVSKILVDFKLITLESAFIVRTFFFFIFGATIIISSLFSLKVFVISALIIIGVYASRYFLFSVVERKDIAPQVYIAPRGLITVLLFFNIPKNMQIDNFNSGVLLYIILSTSIIMAIFLIKNNKKDKTKILEKIEEGGTFVEKKIPEISQDKITNNT